MADYIPRTDIDFNAWLQNFMSYASSHLGGLSITASELAPLTAAQAAWTTAYADHLAKQSAGQAARELKDMQRSAVEVAMRTMVRRLQASAAVSDDERRALGITVRDTTATASSAAVAAASRPVGMVDTSQRLRHEIRFFDQATPTKKAKPAGVMGCEIWVKIAAAGASGGAGGAPADPSELTFVALDTASPYLAEYSGEEAGKMAYYMLRWVTTRNEKGPWSETVAATITG